MMGKRKKDHAKFILPRPSMDGNFKNRVWTVKQVNFWGISVTPEYKGVEDLKEDLYWQIQYKRSLRLLVFVICAAEFVELLITKEVIFFFKLLAYNKGITEFIKSLICFRNSEPYTRGFVGKNKPEKMSNCSCSQCRYY